MDDAMVAAERAKGNKKYYSGWFSRLAENNYAKTCWDAQKLKFRDDGDCKDYVHPTCSGAVTENLINARQQAREKLKKKFLKDEYNKVRPQLDVLKEVLKCPKNGMFGCTVNNRREIDYLLLNIGGNDIGFADHITYIITSGLIRKLKGKKPTVETKIEIKKIITENYRKLSAEFKGLDIKNCVPDTPCERILLTADPDNSRRNMRLKKRC